MFELIDIKIVLQFLILFSDAEGFTIVVSHCVVVILHCNYLLTESEVYTGNIKLKSCCTERSMRQCRSSIFL